MFGREGDGLAASAILGLGNGELDAQDQIVGAVTVTRCKLVAGRRADDNASSTVNVDRPSRLAVTMRSASSMSPWRLRPRYLRSRNSSLPGTQQSRGVGSKAFRRLLTASSTASPQALPKPSLISLKRSRSTMSTASVEPSSLVCSIRTGNPALEPTRCQAGENIGLRSALGVCFAFNEVARLLPAHRMRRAARPASSSRDDKSDRHVAGECQPGWRRQESLPTSEPSRPRMSKLTGGAAPETQCRFWNAKLAPSFFVRFSSRFSTATRR